MKKLTLFSNPSVPVFLLLIAILSFGLLLPQLGFYWDDWAKILVARLWGLRAYFAYYAEDRPLSAWTHIVFTFLLGTSPLPWQILALVLRWLSAWGMWWSLNLLWPGSRRQNLVASLLFLVYPVFVSQPAAVTFHQQWLQYDFFFLSLGAMIAAMRSLLAANGAGGSKPKLAFWLLTLLSLTAMLLQLSVTEYFAPLELVRPVVLWFLLPSPVGQAEVQNRRLAHLWKRFIRVMIASGPYLVVIAVYSAWRLFFIQLPGADPYRANTLFALVQNPLATGLRLIQVVAVDLAQILVNTWTSVFTLSLTDLSLFSLVAFAVCLACASLVVIFLLRYREATNPEEGEKVRSTWLVQALVLGGAGVLLGPLPAWITGRQVVFDFHSDRYAMAAMFGASLLFSAAIEWLVKRPRQTAVLVGLFIAAAVGLQLRVANDYRWIWTGEQRLFWQLSWRAPAIQPGTALFFENEPFPNQGLFSTSAALNLVYPQPEELGHLAYWIYTLRPRYNQPPYAYSGGISTSFRTLSFQGDMSHSLLLYNDPAHANCVWVLSSRDIDNPQISSLDRQFLTISDLNRISPATSAPGFPPPDLIGPEPGPSWCYYFEKADLARQQKNWTQVAQYYNEASTKGLRLDRSGSNAPYEWLPFIEGLRNTGRQPEALSLTRQVFQKESRLGQMLCKIWDNQTNIVDKSAYQQAMTLLGCGVGE